MIGTDDVSKQMLMDGRAINEGASRRRMAIERFCVGQGSAWRQQDAGLAPE